MPLVRCPKHKIPYNDENPRGCPACAREKEGGNASSVMQELARASQFTRRPSGVVSAPVVAEGPVTQQPRIPIAVATRFNQAIAFLKQHRNVSAGAALIVVMLLFIGITGGPTFTEALSPANYSGNVRPLPVSPNEPISIVFSALGTQPSQPNPTSATMERYSYGTDLVIDALNGS